MGDSSSASSSGQQDSGGNITVNPPNYALYIVLALGLVVAAYVFLKKGRH